MTLARTRRVRRRGLRRAAVTSPVVVCLAAALVAGGSTYALWADAVAFGGGTVTAGDLNVTIGTPSWRQLTAGATGAGTSETVLEGTPDFRSMPGDVVEIRVPVTTTLVGDNLNAGLVFRFADPSGLGGDVAEARFHVEDGDGVQVAPAPAPAPAPDPAPAPAPDRPAEPGGAKLTEDVVVPYVVGDSDGETDDWMVVVTVDVGGDYRWITPGSDEYPGNWTVGDLVVSLTQVRSGPGYVTEVGP